MPTNGWYEWEGFTSPKTPLYIHPKEQGLTAFAGLWDQWRVDEGITLLSFTILTTPANGPVKHLHHRMPVRLPEDKWQDWLDPDVKSESTMESMLTGDDLDFDAVSKVANSVRAQGPNLILKVAD